MDTLVRNKQLETLRQLENKYLNFKLGEGQVEALLSIFNFILYSKDVEYSLIGSAGTGKSSITKLIIKFLDLKHKDYILAAPTHKSKEVLSKVTDKEAITLHSLLSLRPTVDITELDYKDLQFTSDSCLNNIPLKGVLIVDECSMVNKYLYKFIIDKVTEQSCKVIWIGDDAQLRPVKENALSTAFNAKNRYKLTEVYRQANDNPLLDILCELRTKPLYKFNDLHNQSIIVYDSWQPFLTNNMHLFQEAIKTHNPYKCKLLAYTNKRVSAFNNVIRERIFNSPDEYCIGDILMAYESCEYCDNKYSFPIINAEEYIVIDIQEEARDIGEIPCLGYRLKLYSVSEGVNKLVWILSLKNSQETFSEIATYIESLRLQAMNSTKPYAKRKNWKQYFDALKTFTTPIDLIYENRVVRKKSLDYGYCITVHKSQGSTYENVLIDMGNILLCKNKTELQQLQYVALSRTKNNIFMLI